MVILESKLMNVTNYERGRSFSQKLLAKYLATLYFDEIYKGS